MKLTIFYLVFLALSVTGKECIYDTAGLCMYDCPPGTFSYNTGCSPKTNEPTCDEPKPVPDDYDICDYSACYCNPPTIRDTASNTCVKPEDCPKKKQ